MTKKNNDEKFYKVKMKLQQCPEIGTEMSLDDTFAVRLFAVTSNLLLSRSLQKQQGGCCCGHWQVVNLPSPHIAALTAEDPADVALIDSPANAAAAAAEQTGSTVEK